MKEVAAVSESAADFAAAAVDVSGVNGPARRYEVVAHTVKVFEVFAMVLMATAVVLLKAVCNFVAVTCLRRRIGGGSDGISVYCICDGVGCNVGGLGGVMLVSAAMLPPMFDEASTAVVSLVVTFRSGRIRSPSKKCQPRFPFPLIHIPTFRSLIRSGFSPAGCSRGTDSCIFSAR